MCAVAVSSAWGERAAGRQRRQYSGEQVRALARLDRRLAGHLVPGRGVIGRPLQTLPVTS